jgi:hypothetical protein
MATMTLHSFVWPHVRPGAYRVDTRQEMTGGGLGSGDVLPARTHHLEVTAPRFSMPGNEVFGVFPPPNADGPFAGRLAQIVLRSRTLPWDRASSATQPWLALVVLADGEATFLPDVPANTAYTAGRAPPGIPSDARGAALEVPQKTIDDAFPAAAELELLVHARQVDPTETEYADSDGWVSVVIANRLPLPGQAYGAYLISLEGQVDLLPEPGAVEQGGVNPGVFEGVIDLEDILQARVVIGGSGLPIPGGPLGPVGPVGPVGPIRSDRRPTSAFRTNDARRPVLAEPAGVRSVFNVTASRLVHHDIDWAVVGELAGIDAELVATSRFPVLAHWEFSCSEESGDFAGYMNHLDVGLLGTAPIDDPRARVVPVSPTGHVSIEHTDRRGNSGRAWYRAPLTPSKITREPAGQPYHVADQARRVGTDGREDLSYAAAFEVGRLLAMSDLQYLRALRLWVRQELVTRRQIQVIGPYLEELAIDIPYDVEFARLATREVLLDGGIGGDPRTELGPPLTVHEAEELIRTTDTQVLARGLGLEAALVAEVLGTGIVSQPVRGGVLDLGINTFEEVADAGFSLGGLRGELDQFVGEIDANARAVETGLEAGTAGPLIVRLTEGSP